MFGFDQITADPNILGGKACVREMRQAAKPPTRRNRTRVIPFTRLRGVLKPDGPLPSDAQLQDSYTEYLVEKYL